MAHCRQHPSIPNGVAIGPAFRQIQLHFLRDLLDGVRFRFSKHGFLHDFAGPSPLHFFQTRSAHTNLYSDSKQLESCLEQFCRGQCQGF